MKELEHAGKVLEAEVGTLRAEATKLLKQLQVSPRCLLPCEPCAIRRVAHGSLVRHVQASAVLRAIGNLASAISYATPI